MVLRQGTRWAAGIAAVLTLGAPTLQGISERDAMLRAQSFVLVASKGMAPNPIEPPDWSAKQLRPTTSTDRFERHLWLSFVLGTVAVTDEGRITAACLQQALSLPTTWQENKALSTATLLRVAQTYFEAAGYEGRLMLNYCKRPDDWRSETCFVLSATPSYNGIPYSFGTESLFFLEHTTGRLQEMSLPFDSLPSPPSTLTPGISRESAAGAVLAYLRNHENVSRAYLFKPVELGIWAPRKLLGYDGLNQEDLDRQAAGKGMLVYYGVVFDLDRTSADLQETRGSFGVIVDAEDGRVITMWANRSGGFGGGSAVPKPYQWNLTDSSAKVFKNGRCVYEGPVQIDFVRLDKHGPIKGLEVRIQSDKVVYSASFDGKTGLLSLPTQGRYSIGRPDAHLLNVLKGGKQGE